MISGKVWGTTTTLLTTPMVELHRIEILEGGTCSLHEHAHKWNGFYVISGSLDIEAHKKDYDLIDVTNLTKGEFTAIPPGEYHRFVALEDTIALELYWINGIDPKDIVRTSVGSI